MSELFQKISNILEASNNYRNNQNLYYTLKDYIFRKVCYILSTNKNALQGTELSFFENALNEFKAESNRYSPTNFMSKQDYCSFLEVFFSKMDFENINNFMLNVCKDLTEVLEVYGQLDDLWLRRSKYKIIIFII